MELLLTDAEAIGLIGLLKSIVRRHRKTISYPANGTITIKSFSDNQREFSLIYFLSEDKKVFQFMDNTTKLTLLRVNLNRGFHKNANGERIHGNRINVFSEEEFFLKNDGQTHIKCYPLPYDSIPNTENIFEMFESILDYTNTQNNDLLSLTIQEGLEI